MLRAAHYKMGSVDFPPSDVICLLPKRFAPKGAGAPPRARALSLGLHSAVTVGPQWGRNAMAVCRP